MWTRAENRNGRAWMVLVAVMMLGLPGIPGGAVWAQEESDRGGAAERQGSGDASRQVDVRVYDISGLVRPTRDYPFDSDVVVPTRLLRENPRRGGSGTGMGAGMFGGGGMAGGIMPGAGGAPAATPGGVVDGSQAITVEGVMQLLRASVETESWRANGGRTGNVQALGGRLVVTQTPANQQRVAAILKELRQSVDSRRMVTVRARWVRLGPDQLQEIWGNGGGVAQAVESWEPERTIYRAQITCFDGQRVHLASGRGRLVVMDIEPVVATDAIAYDPVTRMVLMGAVLEVTPTLSPEGNTVVMDVRSVISSGDEENPGNPGNPGERADDAVVPMVPQFDRLDFILQHFSTTREMPLGKPVLVGGMTVAAGGGAPLYLVLEVSAPE